MPFGFRPVWAADGHILSVRHPVAPVFHIHPGYKSQIDAVALMRAEKRVILHLGQQRGQLAVKLYGTAVFHGKNHAMRPLLQTHKLRKGNLADDAVLCNGQTRRMVLLQPDQAQKIVHILLPHRLLQIFQHRKAIAFQRMLGAHCDKGDGDMLVHLPNLPHRFHAGHAIHVNVHQQQVKHAGAKRLQQFFAVAELSAGSLDGGLFQQGEQLFPLLRTIVADRKP